MHTSVIISTRGFGIFRFNLLKEPENIRFIGIFSELDVGGLPDHLRQRFHQIHVVPCGARVLSQLNSSLVDFDATRAVLSELQRETAPAELSIHSYDEQNVLVAAQLRSYFGITGPKYEDILAFRDKCVMKQKLVAKQVRVPKFGHYHVARFAADKAAYFRQIVSEVGLPFILKPLDSAGGDGVYKITSWADFETLPGDLGRGYEYEEFITGTMYSVNIISKDRKTIFGGVTEYLVNSFDVQSGKVNADINLIDHDPRVAPMIRFAESALDALGWPNGASHLELFLTAACELVFLEVAARFKGMAGLAAMERNYGVALVNLSFEAETGVESHPYDELQSYCFDGVLPKKNGVVERLVEPEAQSACKLTWKVKPGEALIQTSSLLENAGTFIMWNRDYEVLYDDFRRLASYSPIVYKQPAQPVTEDDSVNTLQSAKWQ